MVAFNFQKRFCGDVAIGKKLNTARRGKQRAKVGDELQLYYGQRTKQCRKLTNAICVSVQPIRIGMDYGISLDNNAPLDSDEQHLFAEKDGFRDIDDLMKFFFPETRMTDDDFVGYFYTWKLK